VTTVSLSCQEVVELVTDYLEGALPPRELELFEHHLSRCAGCTAFVEQMRATITLTRTVRADDLSPATRAAIVEDFRGWSAA
jgi:anti-sigma factor RsiW